jgi:hypothetical protein
MPVWQSCPVRPYDLVLTRERPGSYLSYSELLQCGIPNKVITYLTVEGATSGVDVCDRLAGRVLSSGQEPPTEAMLFLSSMLQSIVFGNGRGAL